MRILKLNAKVSLLLKQQGTSLLCHEDASPEFAQLWQTMAKSSAPKAQQDIRPELEALQNGMNTILDGLEQSKAININIGDEEHVFELGLYPMPEHGLLLLTLENISAIKGLQKKIQRQNNAFDILDQANSGVIFQISINPQNKFSIDFISTRLSQTMQLPRVSVPDFINALDDNSRLVIRDHFLSRREHFEVDGVILKPQKRHWKARASILEESDDGHVTYLGILENMTDQVEQLEQLNYTSSFLSSITQNIPIAIAVSHIPDKRYLYVNPELCRISDHPESAFISGGLAFTRDHLLADAEQRDGFFAGLDNARNFYKNPAVSLDHAFESPVKIRTSKGEERTLFTTFRPLGTRAADGAPDTFIHISQDITERLEREQQKRQDEILLVQSHKMVELGEMASCIAHEINNPLSIMSHLLENIEQRYPSDSDVSRSFQTLERIHKIVKALTHFARSPHSPSVTLKPIPLRSIIEDLLLLCQNRLTNHNIRFDYEGELDLCPKINDTLLAQVLLNLVNNSYDALEEVKGDNKWLKITATRAGDQLELNFCDSGKSAGLKEMNRWLTPFYSTKPPGRGTGLGLAICQTLLQSHQGRIIPIESEHTCFKIELPFWPDEL